MVPADLTRGREGGEGRTRLPGPDSMDTEAEPLGPGVRGLSFLAGVGMVVASLLSLRHYFQSNYPTSLYEGSFCDVNAFFNCDSSAYSALAEFGGVPMAYWGAFMGLLVMVTSVLPSRDLHRTTRFLHGLNALSVVALFLISVLVLGSLCLLCAVYYAFALAGFAVVLLADGRKGGFVTRFRSPSVRYLLVLAFLSAVGAMGVREYHAQRVQAQAGGVAAKVVEEFFRLEPVQEPSLISPFLTARATEGFHDAPVHIIEYADLLCSDCRFLAEQLTRLKREFDGKLNIAFQFFPLEAACNEVVEKDKHPGACDLSYMAAHDSAKFLDIHDEIFANFESAKTPEWREELARRYGVEDAVNDPETRELVHRLIATGAEYDKTSDRYSHGIRSTPTMIINDRMVIGTLPYDQLRAIIVALLEEQVESNRFMESWVKR